MRLSEEYANVVISNTTDGIVAQQISQQFNVTLNLRNVIGNDMYDNNETFAICLNSLATFMQISSFVVTDLTAKYGTFGAGTNCYVGMSGLPFVNTNKNNSIMNFVLFPDSFTIGGGQVLTTAYKINNFYNANTKCIMFRKPKSSIVTLTVGIYTQLSSQPIRAGNSTNPTQTTIDCNFSIYSVEEEE